MRLKKSMVAGLRAPTQDAPTWIPYSVARLDWRLAGTGRLRHQGRSGRCAELWQVLQSVLPARLDPWLPFCSVWQACARLYPDRRRQRRCRRQRFLRQPPVTLLKFARRKERLMRFRTPQTDAQSLAPTCSDGPENWSAIVSTPKVRPTTGGPVSCTYSTFSRKSLPGGLRQAAGSKWQV